MNATVVEIDQWHSTSFEVSGNAVYARGVRPESQRRCPHCQSIIYSRRHNTCGVCFERLPDQCLFSAQECNSVELLVQEERQRHRAWLSRANFSH